MPDTWVQRSADDFASAIENELPQGEAWPRDPAGDLMLWVDGCAQVWGGVEQRSADLLLVESDPRYTVELLPDWERAFGLPDPCVPRILTLPERQTALVSKLTVEGGQSAAFFIGVALTLGYAITIQEYRPFQFGLSSFGGKRGALNGPAFRFLWTVVCKAGRLTRFCFGVSSFGRDSFLEIVRAEDLECIFNRWKPAQTLLFFDYATDGVALPLVPGLPMSAPGQANIYWNDGGLLALTYTDNLGGVSSQLVDSSGFDISTLSNVLPDLGGQYWLDGGLIAIS